MFAQDLAKRPLVVLIAILTLFTMAMPALAGGRPLTAELSADNEVPPNASGTSGTAHITLNQGLGEVCFEIEATEFSSGVLFSHIHSGGAGVNGPVVVVLFDPGAPGPDVTLPADTGFFSDCIEDVDPALIKDIRQNPADYYVNVHTLVNPGGEIRGQLSK